MDPAKLKTIPKEKEFFIKYMAFRDFLGIMNFGNNLFI